MNRFATFVWAGLATLVACGLLEAQQQGQAQKGQSGNTAGQKGGSGAISQTPWFGDQGIRKQLNLNDEQFNRLNKAYGEAWGGYQKGMKQLGTDLNDADRRQRTGALETNFYKSFSSGANDVFTDPAQRQRFNQLSLQYRGYGALSDPMVQEKLNLTSEQRQKLEQFNREWTTQMNDVNRAYQTDREDGTRRFTEMRKQMNERINSLLNPQQQQTWRQLTGDSYDFQPGVYFQNSGQGSTSGQGSSNSK